MHQILCRGKDEKGKGFGAPAPSGGGKAAPKQDARWELRPAATEEWEAWLRTQKEAAGVKGDDVYVQVRLHGAPSEGSKRTVL